MPKRMGYSRTVLALIVIICSILSQNVLTSYGQDVLGAGGFIRSKKNIDFSRIQIELYSQTQAGVFRKVETTDAAPNNGYYFIPVEETGHYRLKPIAPLGWKIEPEERIVNIDGKTDDQEFDFEFIGFGITGSIYSRSQLVGPPGIEIELVSPEAGGQNVLQTSKTDENGQYVFFGVLPGRYILRIGQEYRSKYDFDTQQHAVDVSEDVGASVTFQILGYRIIGSITTSNGDNLPNVKFVLSSSSGKSIKTAISNSEGYFTFSNVDNGDYLVKLDSAEAGQTSLQLVTTEMPIKIDHDHQNVPNFVVKSFTLDGGVIASSNTKRPLADVKIKATFGNSADEVGLETVTDKLGKFSLTGVQSGRPLKVKAALDGYDFEGISLSSVTPRSVFSTITPARYRLSGHIERENLPTGAEIKVRFASASAKTDSTAAGGKVIVSAKGTFSIYLPAGKYAVSVELGSDQKGIGFAPVKQEVKVEDAPVSNINFQPIKADLKGKVECLDRKNCASVNVILSSTHSQVVAQKQIEVKGDGKFHFASILPATYKLAVSEDNRCWENPTQELVVSNNIDNIVFRQLGYYVTVNSRYSTTLLLSNQEGKKIQQVSIQAGKNVICVKSNKMVSLSTRGCEEFEITPNKINLSDDVFPTVTLTPIRYRVSGRIKTIKEISDLGLTAKSDQRHEKLSTKRDEKGYSFSFWAYPGEDIAFHPHSEEFLFDPEAIHIFVDHTCHVDKVIFEATSGFFLRGQITPPVAGVKVEIQSPKLQNQKQSFAMTDEEGFYKIGPLPSENKYEIGAKKDGYIFEKVSAKSGNFVSKKLAAIVVGINDGEMLEINGAVVSVSGGKAYRSNTHTKAGSASFLSLSPGEYFIKPQLKEYEFDPKHQLITVKEGETAQVKFRAKRIAFSIFGKMVSLNGEVESGIILRAKGQNAECKDHSEEATSELNGEFRFRGLHPGCQYSIGLQEGVKTDIEKLIPKETPILMQEKDMHVSNPIVALRAVEIMDISLKISDESDAKSEATVKVSMKSDDNNGYSYSGKKVIGELIVLPPVPKDNKRYTIIVETFAEKFAPKKKATTGFRADSYFKFVTVVLPKVSNTPGAPTSRKTSNMFIFVAPFFILTVIAFLSRDKLPTLFTYINDKISKHTISTQTSSQTSNLKDSTDSGDDSATLETFNLGGIARKRTKKRLA